MLINDAAPARSQATAVLATVAVLALLYFGREILVPVVLALFLGALLNPWVRFCSRLGLGHGVAMILTVLATLMITLGMALLLGSQLSNLARSLPQYQSTIDTKMQTLRGLTVDRLASMQGELGRVVAPMRGSADLKPTTAIAPPPIPTATVPVATSSTSLTMLTRLLTIAWTPLQTGGIVLVVLAFVLLEHESLRDRFIRLAGGNDLRATTLAINDATARLSRFFISTFLVNVSVGLTIGTGLWLIGLPNALLWGVLAAILRFVPYVGVWLVAGVTILFAAAVGPAWTLAVTTAILFAAVESIVSQVIEPLLYGHTAGLSPLAVVVSAIFWSWLWGPVGLVMSTPLTLCLVVAGRHVKALDLLTILLGDTPALSMPQRFYQRALSGDAQEILDEARRYLKRRTFGSYCDAIVLPALQFGRIDLDRGMIRAEQLKVLRETIVTVIETLNGEGRTRLWRRHRPGVLSEANLGRELRRHREEAHGDRQVPLAVPAGSIAFCTSMGSAYDDLVTELLTRVLCGLHIDARHLAVDDLQSLDSEPQSGLTSDAVALIYLVDTEANISRERVNALAAKLRQRMSAIHIVVLCPSELLAPSAPDMSAFPHVDAVVGLLEEAAQHALPKSG